MEGRRGRGLVPWLTCVNAAGPRMPLASRMPAQALNHPPRGVLRAGDHLLRHALALSNDDPIPKAMGLALAIPRSEDSAFGADVERLYREIHALARFVDRDREVVELVVDASAAAVPMSRVPWAELLGVLQHQFRLPPSAARSILMSAPHRGPSTPDVASLGTSGFGILGLDFPQLDDGLVRTAHRYGIGSVAVALKCEPACPAAHVLQQAGSIALVVRPDRLEVRSPDPVVDAAGATSAAVRDHLEQAGYEFIGPEQYALPTDALAAASRAGSLRWGSFGYTATPDCDQLGMGPGAVSAVGGYRGRNAHGLDAWREAVDSGQLPVSQGIELTPEDQLRADVRQQVLCRRVIMIEEIELEYDVDFRRHFDSEIANLAQLASRAHIRDCGDRIEVCSQGWPWLRNIARCFDLHR